MDPNGATKKTTAQMILQCFAWNAPIWDHAEGPAGGDCRAVLGEEPSGGTLAACAIPGRLAMNSDGCACIGMIEPVGLKCLFLRERTFWDPQFGQRFHCS